MKIAYVVPRCLPSNSHGGYVLELARVLGQDHDVRIFSSAFPADRTIPATLTRIPLPDRPAVARLAAWWAVSRFLVAGGRFDVIHTQGGDAPVGTVVSAPCCNRAIRLALEAAGEAGRSYARRRPAWLTGVTARLAETADRTCLSRAGVRRVIVPARHVERDLDALYGVPPAKMTLVPYGVDLDAFSPAVARARRAVVRQAFGFRPADVVAVYVGGAYRLKGLLPLLEALRRVPDPAFRLMAVGVRENAELAGERARGLEGRVTFAGRVPDIADAYAAGDLFVHPTLYDGFSLATLEAMASGLPVVVSRRAGVADLLADGREGVLLEQPTDPDEIARALERLRGDAPGRAELGGRARATAELNSSETMARRTLAVYQSVDGGAG